MNKDKKCFNSESYSFALKQVISRTVREEKLKIAKSLLEKTDLSLAQIADIVGLKKDELEKAFRYTKRDKEQVKYHVQSRVSAEEQLFKELDENLSNMKKKQNKLSK